MRMDAPASVYLLRDPRNGQVRKVGITQLPPEKKLAILWAGRGLYRHRGGRWLEELRESEVAPDILIVEELPTVAEARGVERIVSAALRIAGCDLLNSEGEALFRNITGEMSPSEKAMIERSKAVKKISGFPLAKCSM